MQDFLSQRLCKLESLPTAACVLWRKKGQTLLADLGLIMASSFPDQFRTMIQRIFDLAAS